jgi:hypothetical protein
MLPRIYERDIDVVVQEELLFSEAVRALVAKALGLAGPLHVERCQLSVVDETGETDVLATISLGDRHGVILIENKIDAAFQPRQPERYRERAVIFGSRSGVELVFCILVAPKEYVLSGADAITHFDAVITYEELADATARDGTPRSRYRGSLLARALESARNAYIMVPSQAASRLWQRIYRIASGEFPQLRMPVPTDKGSQSKWVIFKANLPPRITIDWKISKATVDLSFWKGAKPRPNGNVDFSKLKSGATLELLGTTTAIRIPVTPPPTDWTELSEDAIRDALRAAEELLTYFRNTPQSFS